MHAARSHYPKIDLNRLQILDRVFLGWEAMTVGYTSGSPATYTVRWTPNGGSTWQDSTASAGTAPGDYSGDLLQTRASGHLFATWCGYDTSNRANVMCRRGVFVLQ